MLIFLSELIGTAILIVLGTGVVANVTLEKSGMKGAGALQITLGWGLAVMIPVFIFAESSGAHFNPALTLALAFDKAVNSVVVAPDGRLVVAASQDGKCCAFENHK